MLVTFPDVATKMFSVYCIVTEYTFVAKDGRRGRKRRMSGGRDRVTLLTTELAQ